MLEGIVDWWRRRRDARLAALTPEREIHVEFSDRGVSVRYPNGSTEKIAWREGADVWWSIEGNGERCAFPQGATGEAEILEALPTIFPGFSHEAVIEAMGCTANARFVCWDAVEKA